MNVAGNDPFVRERAAAIEVAAQVYARHAWGIEWGSLPQLDRLTATVAASKILLAYQDEMNRTAMEYLARRSFPVKSA